MSSKNRSFSYNPNQPSNQLPQVPNLLPNNNNKPNTNTNNYNLIKKDISYHTKQKSLNNSMLDYDHKNQDPHHQNNSKQFQHNKKPTNDNGNYLQLHQNSTTQTFRNTKHNHKECILEQQKINKTTNKLFGINFSHHQQSQCVCSLCTCGRHYCKLHVVRPDMKINSIYRNDFHQKKPLQPLSHRPKSSKRPVADSPNLDIKTIYGKDFYQRKPGVQKLHPQDCLNIGGPALNLTTYSSGFPGYRCENQYVKPTFNANNNGLMPFKGESIYRNSYFGKFNPASDLAKWNPHFKTGEPWLGNSIYRQKFKQPNLDEYPQIRHIQQKLEKNPDYQHQYESIYRNDFLNKGSTVCPSKILIERQNKGALSSLKGKFNQNSDFKAMSPDFHAIATSKHSYV